MTTKATVTGKKVGPKTTSRLPDFSKMTIQEEAEFWDTTDSAEYEDEFVDVTDDDEYGVGIALRSQKKRPMTVRLEPDIITLLTQEAKSQGIGPSTLARMVILRHLKDSGTGTYIKRPKKTAKRTRTRGVA
jgi:hypothetical protein